MASDHSDRLMAYHVRQYDTLYRSTARLRDLLKESVDPGRVRDVLDAGCGAGANLYHLAESLPDARWVGLDMSRELLETGRRLLSERWRRGAPPELVEGDFNRLVETFGAASFDVVLSIQVLSWIPHYRDALSQLLGVLRPGGVLLVTSLYTDYLVDATVSVEEYDLPGFATSRGPLNYNVYCLERFTSECVRSGAKDVSAVDFDIDIELSPPADRLMGTYTRRAADGRLMQFSGPLHMPWKFVVVRK